VKDGFGFDTRPAQPGSDTADIASAEAFSGAAARQRRGPAGPGRQGRRSRAGARRGRPGRRSARLFPIVWKRNPRTREPSPPFQTRAPPEWGRQRASGASVASIPRVPQVDHYQRVTARPAWHNLAPCRASTQASAPKRLRVSWHLIGDWMKTRRRRAGCLLGLATSVGSPTGPGAPVRLTGLGWVCAAAHVVNGRDGRGRGGKRGRARADSPLTSNPQVAGSSPAGRALFGDAFSPYLVSTYVRKPRPARDLRRAALRTPVRGRTPARVQSDAIRYAYDGNSTAP